MLRWEAAIMAATGTTVGLTLGALLGWAATRAFELSATDVPVGRHPRRRATGRTPTRRRPSVVDHWLAASALMSRVSRTGLGAPERAAMTMARPSRSVSVTMPGNRRPSSGSSGPVTV